MENLQPMRKELICMSSLNGQWYRIIHFLQSVSLGRIYSIFSSSLLPHYNLQENLMRIIKPICCKNEPARTNHCPWQNELLSLTRQTVPFEFSLLLAVKTFSNELQYPSCLCFSLPFISSLLPLSQFPFPSLFFLLSLKSI